VGKSRGSTSSPQNRDPLDPLDPLVIVSPDSSSPTRKARKLAEPSMARAGFKLSYYLAVRPDEEDVLDVE
jgi:hypothetical protein